MKAGGWDGTTAAWSDAKWVAMMGGWQVLTKVFSKVEMKVFSKVDMMVFSKVEMKVAHWG